MNSPSVLYLLPMPISEIDINWTIPLNVISQIKSIQVFIVENSKTSRHFLKSIDANIDWQKISIFELDKHKPESQNMELTEILKKNDSVGLMSDAGLPCIADPGNHVVRIAHDLGIKVKPLNGPSSIILALIASGLNGQQFKFNGYLPFANDNRKQLIGKLERESTQCTQLFIETPYRNDKLLLELTNSLNHSTRLLIASDITGENEFIACKTIADWKKNLPVLGKVPCIFGIGAQ